MSVFLRPRQFVYMTKRAIFFIEHVNEKNTYAHFGISALGQRNIDNDVVKEESSAILKCENVQKAPLFVLDKVKVTESNEDISSTQAERIFNTLKQKQLYPDNPTMIRDGTAKKTWSKEEEKYLNWAFKQYLQKSGVKEEDLVVHLWLIHRLRKTGSQLPLLSPVKLYHSANTSGQEITPPKTISTGGLGKRTKH